MSTKALDTEIDKLVAEFAVSKESLDEISEYFVKTATASLATETERGIPMIPTYVTKLPTGKETGSFLACDLGGTNFRCCSVKLHGDSTHEIMQEKWRIPHEILNAKTYTDFYGWLASCLGEFVSKHHPNWTADQGKLRMGFTFSYPVKQTGLNRGTLVRWTKTVNVHDAIGRDVCIDLQSAIDRKNIPVHIAALINDTTGALLARAYMTGESSETLLGMIVGTGTNAAYMEGLSKVTKLSKDSIKHSAKSMAINTEWGSFDNDLKVLPTTRFDAAIDKLTLNPTVHMFEKRISGMFMGEILRQVLCELREKNLIFVGEPTNVLEKAFSTDTSTPSLIEADSSSDNHEVKRIVKDHFGITANSHEAAAIRKLSHAIGKRAAYLTAAAIGGVAKMTNALEKYQTIDIGGDGSVYEHYPGFEKHMREALRLMFSKADEERFVFGVVKDGSGIGAALCASLEGDEA